MPVRTSEHSPVSAQTLIIRTYRVLMHLPLGRLFGRGNSRAGGSLQ
nr:MAG TPA: hypothetical protein [Caudoviricetes sp.]